MRIQKKQTANLEIGRKTFLITESNGSNFQRGKQRLILQTVPFPPSLAKYLYWRDLFTLKSSASQMSCTFISTPDILTERTKTLGCFVKLKDAVSIIVDCCRSLSRRKGWFRSHQWRAALKQPPIFLPAIIIIIERCNTLATGYINQ